MPAFWSDRPCKQVPHIYSGIVKLGAVDSASPQCIVRQWGAVYTGNQNKVGLNTGPEKYRWSLGELLICGGLENLGDTACRVKDKC